MNALLAGAAFTAMGLTFAACSVCAAFVVVPWLRRQGDPRRAIAPLLWIHVPRHVALLIFSEQAAGLSVSSSLRNQIVLGDLLGTVLALGALISLSIGKQATRALAWLLVLTTLVDIGNAAIRGLQENLFDVVTGLPWIILTFYVPVLLVSVGLLAYQLYVTRPQAIFIAS